MIPVKKLRQYLSKVIDRVQSPSTDTQIDLISIERINCALNLISSYLYLMKELKNKEISSENTEFYLMNEQGIDLDSPSQRSQTEESVNVFSHSDTSILLSTCLSNLEYFFATYRNRIFKDNSRESAHILSNICLCLIIILENGLYAIENFYPFLRRMLSSGNISFLIQLMVTNRNESTDEDFKKALSSFLSNFLIQMQKFAQQNDIDQELSLPLTIDDLKQGFDLLNGLCYQILA